MGRNYAGILGSLAGGIYLVRGAVFGAEFDQTMLTAVGVLFGFALLGLVAGNLADRFTSESVRSRFQAAVAELAAERNKTPQVSKNN